MTTLEAITARMKKLQAQADALATKETAKVLKTIRELMAEHGLTAADIDGHASGKRGAKNVGTNTVGKKNAAAAAKYRDPKSGTTWSGRGRAPSWIASEKIRDRFLVGESATTTPANAGKAKTAAKESSKAASRSVGPGAAEGTATCALSRPENRRDVERARSSAGVAGWCQRPVKVFD